MRIKTVVVILGILAIAAIVWAAAATDTSNTGKYWDSGLPMGGLTDNGNFKYWDSGLPAKYIIPTAPASTTDDALFFGSFF